MNLSDISIKYKTILITGGAGFVGSNLALSFKNKYPRSNIITLDNLKRRGSELNINRLKDNDITFIHGDVRNREDIEFSDTKIDLIIECSAEPSVLAGYNSSPEYVLKSNLNGAINCLETARIHKADFIFLSTSRVYPVETINNLNFREDETRYSLTEIQSTSGISDKGISEKFPLAGPRSMYGATKLAAELIALEYENMYGIKTIINRCGVIAGPWQMGKVDQGVFSLWMATHYFKKSLKYIGFNGSGKQVRDLLHISDLFDLLDLQLKNIDGCTGKTFNVGGGLSCSLSLLETTSLCQEISGNTIKIEKAFEDRPADLKYYVSDYSEIEKLVSWNPRKNPRDILSDIWNWIHENESELKKIFA